MNFLSSEHQFYTQFVDFVSINRKFLALASMENILFRGVIPIKRLTPITGVPIKPLYLLTVVPFNRCPNSAESTVKICIKYFLLKLVFLFGPSICLIAGQTNTLEGPNREN